MNVFASPLNNECDCGLTPAANAGSDQTSSSVHIEVVAPLPTYDAFDGFGDASQHDEDDAASSSSAPNWMKWRGKLGED